MKQGNLFNDLKDYSKPMPTDVCANRHCGNSNSVAANERAEPTKESDRAAILAWLRTQGLGGGTSKEFAAFTGRPLNCISGRWTELVRDKVIHRTSMSRDGAAVHVLMCWANM